MASFENTKANEKYSSGRTDLGLDFSATAASSVAMVSLAMIGDLTGIKRDLHQMIWYIHSRILLRMDDVLVLSFSFVICKEVLVSDSIDVGMTRGFDRGANKVGFMLFRVRGEGTEKFLGLVQRFLNREGFLNLVNCRVDFLKPG